uniref:Uncharacterized protein n=1 Tax=Arundo donax TaxID=35708 RepID=A0A0A9H6P6_ARUDO
MVRIYYSYAVSKFFCRCPPNIWNCLPFMHSRITSTRQ